MNVLSNRGNQLALAGLALAVAGTMFWFNRAEAVAIPENRVFFLVAWIGAVGLGVAAFFMGAGWPGRIVALPAIVLGLFLTFTVSISEQILPPNAIRVGDTIPAFSAVDERGELFESERLRGHPVLIKFFRAHW